MENISTPERKITIGATMLNCGSDTPYGGKFTESANLKKNQKLREFLAKHWNTNKCEEGKNIINPRPFDLFKVYKLRKQNDIQRN